MNSATHRSHEPKTSPFKKRRKRLRPDQWKVQFKRFLRNNPTFERGFNRIVKAGCEEGEILELLYGACYSLPDEAIAFKKSIKHEIREARRIASEAQLLAQQVQEMNAFALAGRDLEEDLFCVKDERGTRFVPFANFAVLPQLLRDYSQRLNVLGEAMPDLNEMDLKGPELAILAVYIHEVTRETPYLVLSQLLQAADEFLSRVRYRSPDAVRKLIKRYKRDHPHAWAIVEELIVAYVSRTRSSSPDPAFWGDLYERLYDPSVDDIVRKKP
jgi:hypothetical protein